MSALLLALLLTACFVSPQDAAPRLQAQSRLIQSADAALAPVFLLLALAASTVLAADPARSWRLIILLASGAAVASLTKQWTARFGPARLLAVLAATATAVAGWGLADFFAGRSARVAAPLGHHNYIAGFLLLHVPLTFWLASRARAPRRWLWLAGAVLQCVAVVLTGSLAGTGVLTLLALFGVAVSFTHWRENAPGARASMVATAGIAFVLLAVLLFSAMVMSQRIPGGPVGRLAAIAKGQQDPSLSLENRKRYFRTALAMFAERPVSGWGLGSVPLVSSLYREQTPGVEPAGEALPQLHGLPGNLLAETGVLGVAAFSFLLFTLFVAGRGVARLSVAGYFLFSLSDYQLDLPAIVLALGAVAGISLARTAEPGDQGAAARVASNARFADVSMRVLALSLVGTGLALFAGSSAAHYLYSRGRLAEAARWDALSGFYQFERGVSLESRFGPSDDGAVAAYRAAALRMPDVIPAAEQAGSALVAAGHYRQALPLLERAAALDYYFTLAHFHLGRARLHLGDRKGAIDAFATSFLVQPATVFAEAWTSPPESDVYPEALELAIDRVYQLAAFNNDGLRVAPREWDVLAAMLIGMRKTRPSGLYRLELFESLDENRDVNHSTIVFRREAVTARIAPVVLLSTRPDFAAAGGIGAIRGLPPVRAVDLLRHTR